MVSRDTPWKSLIVPLSVAGILCVIYLVMEPLSADHAAQTFRTELFELSGPTVWNNFWFGGHYLPSYSVLAPPLGAWLGFRVMGVAAVLGHRRALHPDRPQGVGRAGRSRRHLVRGRRDDQPLLRTDDLRPRCPAGGRRRLRRPAWLAGAVPGRAPAPSDWRVPVAALFLACLGFAHWVARRPDRRGLELAAVTFVVAAAVALLFPGRGRRTVRLDQLLPGVRPHPDRGRAGAEGREAAPDRPASSTPCALVASFALNTPMGGNVNRLGVLLIGPLFLCAAWPRRQNLAVIAFVPLFLAWQVFPVIRDLEAGPGRAGSGRRVLRPGGRSARPHALPPARHGWRSFRSSPTGSRHGSRRASPSPAAGSARPTATTTRSSTRTGSIPARYHRWLKRLAVGYVAVPQTELDYAGETEAD